MVTHRSSSIQQFPTVDLTSPNPLLLLLPLRFPSIHPSKSFLFKSLQTFFIHLLITTLMATEAFQKPLMAIEEVNKPSSIPPYTEMILTAITALDDKNGCSRNEISAYIETSHGDLPAGHSTLLTHHLNRMKEDGELIMVKNNYMRPNLEAPLKRGRGRPPKPKSAANIEAAATAAANVVVGPPRSRGRPPKVRDPSAPVNVSVASPKVSSGRPRGRPPKKPRTTDGEEKQKTASTNVGPPRGRGRPPKVKVFD